MHIRKFIFSFLLLVPFGLSAQTDVDAIMMGKRLFCVGPMYNYSGWENYWEGTLKRNNENLGVVTAQSFSVMGNYGITNKLNLLFSIPYVVTKASAGQLKGMQGVQDLSVMAKYRAFQKRAGEIKFALFGVAGVSVPIGNYSPDYLPLSIGLKSRTAFMRLLLDLHWKQKWFVTTLGTYTYRSNITLDRNSYYTTELVLSNEVRMYDVGSFQVRAGYRTGQVIAEAVFNNFNTLGGFDISRNNMPFPSNRMNATTAGFNLKYVFIQKPETYITGGVHKVVDLLQ